MLSDLSGGDQVLGTRSSRGDHAVEFSQYSSDSVGFFVFPVEAPKCSELILVGFKRTSFIFLRLQTQNSVWKKDAN
jgi:hypothetical protein